VTARGRRVLVLAALGGLGLALFVAVADLPAFGDFQGAYGTLLPRLVPGQRHVTALVSAITFDYRGLDTLGEEFILLTAVLGCTVLLRSRRAERAAGGDEGDDPGPVEAPAPTFVARSLGASLVGPGLILGLYMVGHGQVSPGGGFQGGVVLAGALLGVFAAGQSLRLRGAGDENALEVAEALGALGFAAIGAAGLIAGGALLQNHLVPLGMPGSLLSGGTIPMGNLAVGLEVSGAVALVLSEFLDQALLAPRRR
jgi:multicomponent Na+:H+ antiporter subunit B